MEAKTPRFHRVKQHLVDKNVRLSLSDHAFLNDLAKVRFVASKDADLHHYAERKTHASKRLDKLVSAGVLKCTRVNMPGHGVDRVYEFSTERMAKFWGGKKSVVGAKRSYLHDVIVSKIYFAEGRPEDFRVDGDFKDSDKKMFRVPGSDRTLLPDALYTGENGEIIAVESDSGQYSKGQVLRKQRAWKGIKQVWGQPLKSTAKIIPGNNVSIHRF